MSKGIPGANNPLADDEFAGKYHVEGTLGKGGMGLVLAARHIRLDEPVAIKVLLPEIMQMPGMVDRFLREARSASKIKSQHVVRVLDVDVIPSSGAPYMVMERLEGTDLKEICDRGAPIAVSDAISWIVQACEAIGEAHALGIIHRDLKPGNLFLARLPDGSTRIKVLDFGLSKMAPDAATPEQDLTKTGEALGTVMYMSPEQMHSSRSVDRRTDIWALGAILYRLITRSLPFPGLNNVEICARVLSGKPPEPPSTLRPDAPPGLDAVILRCFERDREHRFLTVAGFVEALQPFAAGAARQATPAIGLQSTVDEPTSDAPPPIASTVDDASPDAYPIPPIAPIPAPKPQMGPAVILLIVLCALGLSAAVFYSIW